MLKSQPFLRAVRVVDVLECRILLKISSGPTDPPGAGRMICPVSGSII